MMVKLYNQELLIILEMVLQKLLVFNSLKLKKITESLTFSNEKAMRELGWKPTRVLENFKIE